MSDHDEEFHATADAGSSTYPKQCSALRKNGYVMMGSDSSVPCKIINMSTSKTGKHGHAKVNMTGTGIFDGKKYELMSPSTHNLNVPVVDRKDFLLLDIDGDFLDLMTDDGEQKNDVKYDTAADDVKTAINEAIDRRDGGEDIDISVAILTACGVSQCVGVKVING